MPGLDRSDTSDSMFRRLFGRNRDAAADRLNAAIVSAARAPVLYTEYGVADSLEGRFEMIVLHAALLFRRMAGLDGAQERMQAVFDRIFADVDRALREIGVGDLAVPRRVRRMAEGFYGRAQAYRAALDAQSRADLVDALQRNVFPHGGGDAVRLARYTEASAAALAAQDAAALLAGTMRLPDPAGVARAEAGGAGEGEVVRS